jgi:hemerythrin-like domain-containing protein
LPPAAIFSLGQPFQADGRRRGEQRDSLTGGGGEGMTLLDGLHISGPTRECRMSHDPNSTRRNFIRVSAVAGTGILVAGFAAGAAADDKAPPKPRVRIPPKNSKAGGNELPPTGKEEGAEEDITPPEDLMREHGVLKRLLLVWDESIRRIEGKLDFPVESLQDSAKLMRSFVEDYHEHIEEEFIFPKFRKANKLVRLVDTLKAQHDAGRKATDIVLHLANASEMKDSESRAKLADAMRQFVRMYNPHEAREDTVLFPTLRSIVSQNEFDSMGEEFDKQEDKALGEDGFFKVVDQVAEIEKKFGIYDLTQFTPKF